MQVLSYLYVIRNLLKYIPIFNLIKKTWKKRHFQSSDSGPLWSIIAIRLWFLWEIWCFMLLRLNWCCSNWVWSLYSLITPGETFMLGSEILLSALPSESLRYWAIFRGEILHLNDIYIWNIIDWDLLVFILKPVRSPYESEFCHILLLNCQTLKTELEGCFCPPENLGSS